MNSGSVVSTYSSNYAKFQWSDKINTGVLCSAILNTYGDQGSFDTFVIRVEYSRVKTPWYKKTGPQTIKIHLMNSNRNFSNINFTLNIWKTRQNGQDHIISLNSKNSRKIPSDSNNWYFDFSGPRLDKKKLLNSDIFVELSTTTTSLGYRLPFL